MCNYTLFGKKGELPAEVQLQNFIAHAHGAVLSNLPLKRGLGVFPKGDCLDTFATPEGERVTSKARPLVLPATTHPAACSGFSARTRVVRSMLSISARLVILRLW